MLAILLFAQAAAPDISLRAEVRAKEVRVEQRGSASLTVRAEPDAGGRVQVDAPKAPDGTTVLRDVRVTFDAEARLAAPDARPAETPPPR